ncbi:hypothetical protein C8F01DRAFT_1104502 [Mycena amicta]|nr:hypothetical protein C8F01DRAFT_1104502 [Mycena amicta]
MGVLGLTTFLRDNHHKLSETFTTDHTSPRINIVVDGWSFIYELHRCSNLPWVYGGEYPAFTNIVATVIREWLNVGLNIHFVFDGPAPSLKFPTLVSRLTQTNVTNSLVFFRTSAGSRSNARFLNETRIIPPFCFAACVDALAALAQTTDQIVIHHADEEADPFAVELAGRLGAFVVGNDSDFVILNAEGYMGYIPLDEMIWTAPIVEQAPLVEEDDFQQVRKPKSKKKPSAATTFASGRGIIPPEETSGLSLTFSVYTPAKLAAHLNVPIPLLPLLGAIVGNDFTKQSSSPHKNATIQSILSASSQKGKQKQVESVMDLIDRTVNALLVRSISSMGSGEIEEIIDRIVEATLQYALPKNEEGLVDLWPTEICPLHPADDCPILPYEDREDDDELLKRNDIRGQYLTAYRQGRLHAKVLDVLNTQSYWPRLFLEEPNLETVGRVMGRSIREWGYAILHDGLGLSMPLPSAVIEADEPEEEEEPDEHDEEDEDDVIDGLFEGPSNDSMATNKTHQQPRSPPPSRVVPLPTVTEYVRRGTRIADEPIAVPALVDLVASISSTDLALDVGPEPIVLSPEADRFTLLLRVLKSDTDAVRSLPRKQLTVALCLRWVLQTLHHRALESGSKEREKERWTRNEARCFLSAFAWTPSPPSQQMFPEIQDRNVQLTAQVLTTLENIVHFSQILLISERLPSPASLFSGVEFHACLTGGRQANVPDALWVACVSDITDTFADEVKKPKKKKTQEKAAQPKGTRTGKAGLFDLLADADA